MIIISTQLLFLEQKNLHIFFRFVQNVKKPLIKGVFLLKTAQIYLFHGIQSSKKHYFCTLILNELHINDYL